MARPVSPLGSLGAKAAEALTEDGGSRTAAIEEARRRFSIASLRPQRPPRRAPLYSALAAAAALLIVASFSFAKLWHASPLQFKVDGRAGDAQTWLAATATRPVIVAFSDGTVLDVAPSSRARVVDTNENGADISLESGSIHGQVVHTSKSAWGLIAGPFAVRVTGTRFDLKWEPAAQQFTLAVIEGSVLVSGSIVGTDRPVRTGERLVASVAQGRLEMSDLDAPATADSAVVPADAAAVEAPLTPASEATNAAPSGAAKEPAGASWRELAKSGDLRQAYAAAENHGFQSACDSATPSELLLLGDAARLSGRSDRASEALLALRRRYPHDPRRAAAAFALGKVAFDQQHAYAKAADWFATCVREQPSGPLAREASGRQIEALRNAGDGAGAQRAASGYLTRYPEGPHANVARALLK